VTYEEWEGTVPNQIRTDPLWALRVYRTALYAGTLGQADVRVLMRHGDYDHVGDQLARSTASISANIAEGFSRLGRRERGRYYEFALGSAREAKDWYFKSRDALGAAATDERLALHTSLVRILTVLAKQNRPDIPSQPKPPEN
jgi:four helix bundle protein